MRANRVVFFGLTVAALYAAGASPGEAGQAAQGPQVLATITVPVRLTGLLPAVTGGAIRCVVHGQDFNTQRVGNAVTNFPIDSSTGNFSQNVVVTVTATPGADLSLATRYSCFLELTGPGGVSRNPGGPGSDPWGTPKPGSPLTWQHNGALPQ